MRVRVQRVIAVLVAALCAVAVAPSLAGSVSGDENWSDAFWLAGINGQVQALDSDGAGNLFATGSFTAIDGVTYGHTVQWNGTEWIKMGDGGPDRGLAIAANDQGDVFVSHWDGSISHWDGTTWTQIRADDGYPTPQIVIDDSGAPVIGVIDSAPYRAGVQRWDGSRWVALGRSAAIDLDYYYDNPPITADGQGNLYRGTAEGVQSWDGTEWRVVGVGGAGTLPTYQLQAADDGSLVATTFPFDPNTYFLQTWTWDGTTWTDRGPAVIGNDSIYALGTSPSGSIVAAGRDIVAELGAQSWEPLALTTGGYISTLESYGDDLVVAGSFISAGGLDVTGIGAWNADTGWRTMHGSEHGQGLLGELTAAVITAEGDLVVGGRFYIAGSTAVTNAAMWDGSVWNPMGEGLPNWVQDFVLLDNSIVVLSGGSLYRWNEIFDRWTELNTDYYASLDRIFPDGSGGILAFGYLYGQNVEHYGMARLEGTTWTLLGSPNYVYDAVVDLDGNTVVSGYLSDDSGPGESVAMWNGAAWVPMGDGPGGYANALALTPQGIVAAGRFTLPEGSTSLVLWDGEKWSSLGAPYDFEALELVANPCGGVIASGYSYSDSIDSLVRWNGNGWQSYGSGIGDAIARVLLAEGRDLYAIGSDIYTAGGKASAGVAHWIDPGPAPISAATSIAEILTSCNYDADSHGNVLRLYRAFFDREPDVSGAQYWIDVNTKRQTLDQIADYFTLSEEFTNNYEGMSNEQYLAAVYTNVLGRDYDQGGFDYWLGLLDSGELTRGGVVRWIAANAEFVNAYPYR